MVGPPPPPEREPWLGRRISGDEPRNSTCGRCSPPSMSQPLSYTVRRRTELTQSAVVGSSPSRFPARVSSNCLGDEHHPWLGESASLLAVLEEFLTRTTAWTGVELRAGHALVHRHRRVDADRRAARRSRVECRARDPPRHRAVQLQRAGGREIGTTGDGFVAMFDGPERAVRCALTIIGSLGAIGVKYPRGRPYERGRGRRWRCRRAGRACCCADHVTRRAG